MDVRPKRRDLSDESQSRGENNVENLNVGFGTTFDYYLCSELMLVLNN